MNISVENFDLFKTFVGTCLLINMTFLTNMINRKQEMMHSFKKKIYVYDGIRIRFAGVEIQCSKLKSEIVLF